jgi:molecular chaperone DnaK (HSP70)
MDIENSKYCFRCGWMAGVIRLKTTEIKAGRAGRAPVELEFENSFEGSPTNADVELELFIPEESRGLVSFDTPEEKSQKYIIKADSAEKIKLYLNLNAYAGANQLSFNIRAVSDDASPDRLSKKIYRPYMIKQYRDVTYRVPVEILEPSRLIFNSHLLIFDGDRKTRSLKAVNAGMQEITLLQNQIVIDASEYKAYMSANNVKLAPGGSVEIKVELLDNTDKESITAMNIMYQAQEQTVSAEILLMRRKAVSLAPDIIYDKVVAIDFGTRKTVAAYINAAADIERYSVSGSIQPEVKMIPLEKGRVINYEMPSVIAYTGRETLVGTEAVGSAQTAEIASGMKMQIRNDSILFHKSGAVSARDTREVITDFLKHVKTAVVNEVGDGDNFYIFTLPVLDGDDEDGSMFALQKRVTLDCVRRAGFCHPDEDFNYRVATISEPEAAMCHIVNAVKSRRDSWTGVNLHPDDIICVFDYGGGTLDISFGRYKLVEGMPSVNTIANIGRYLDKDHPEWGRFDLGGNRLDNNLALAVCRTLPEGIVLDEAEFDENNNLVSAKGFSWDSALLPGREWELYIETIIKGNKEKLSEKWDEIDKTVIEKDEYTKLELALDKRTFKDVAFKDLYYAIDAMKDAMKDNGIGQDDLKYIFLVGGSSLIKIIKSRLETEFTPARVYNAYDFSQSADYERIKREAIYPVVNGAAMSYLTRVTDVFDFDMTIAPKAFPDTPGFSIRYRRGDGFMSKQRSLSRRVAAGDWEITARLADGRNIKMGGFTVTPADDIINIKIFAAFIGRKLRVSYQAGKSEAVEVSDLDVGV